MAVRNNGYYADPKLASAFDNIADAFKTPSGSDISGYATADATRQKAMRLQDLYNYAKSDNYNSAMADRMGIAVGNLTGLNTVGAQNQNDATTRRNVDVTNATTLGVADKNNAGALARTYAAPIILGDGQTAVLPQQTQAATGLSQMYRGNVTANQGQQVTLPGGEVISGAPKPLNDSEMKAKILGTLPQEEQRAVALQGVGVSPVFGPDGEPTNVLTPDAAGKTPYAADTRNRQVANYKTADGLIGNAYFDNDKNTWVDSATKAALPQGTQTYTANLQGDKEGSGLGASTKNNIDGMLVDLSLAQDTSKQLRDMVTKNPGTQGIVGSLRGTVQDVVAAGGEVGNLFNVNMAKMKKDIVDGRVDPKVAEKFANFDPNIPATNMLETLLTAQVAKVLDPNGRISNDRYEQVAKALGSGGLTGNSQKTIATLDALDKIIKSRRDILSPTSPVAAAIGQPKPGVAPAAATPAIRTWNPATGALE